MLSIELARQQERNKFAVKGPPPLLATNVRTLSDEGPDAISQRLGVNVNFDGSGMSPWNPLAINMQAITIDRKIQQLKSALMMNGVPEPIARDQANQLLNTVGAQVREEVIANWKTTKDAAETRAAATTAITEKLDKVIDSVNEGNRILKGDTMSEVEMDSKPSASKYLPVETPKKITPTSPIGEEDSKAVAATLFPETPSSAKSAGNLKFRSHDLTPNSAALKYLIQQQGLGFVNYSRYYGFAIKRGTPRETENAIMTEFKTLVGH